MRIWKLIGGCNKPVQRTSRQHFSTNARNAIIRGEVTVRYKFFLFQLIVMDYRSFISRILSLLSLPDPKYTEWKETYCGWISTGGITRFKREEFYDGRCGKERKSCSYYICPYAKEN